MLYRYLLLILLIINGVTGLAQVWRVTDTVTICTGTRHLGVVFGRDSLLLTQVTAGEPDTFEAVWVRTLPVYLLIRDTTIRRGSWFLGEQRYNNVSVNQFGQTTWGCDSNITWVIYFNQGSDPVAGYEHLKWEFEVFPTLLAQNDLTLRLKARIRAQADRQTASVTLSDPMGRIFRPYIEPQVALWPMPENNVFQLELPTETLPNSWYHLTLTIGNQHFTTSFIKFQH
jgi:hypothetical protein